MPPEPAEVKPGVLDWSTVHEPTASALFDNNEPKANWGRYRLSEQQVQQFWRDGFLLNIPILNAEQCDLINEDLKYFTGEKEKHPGHKLLYEFHSNQSGDPDNVLCHSLGHWRMTQLLHDLIFHPKVVVPCSQLLVEGPGETRVDKAVRFWHDQLFLKPAHHGGVVAWHQDHSYWTRTVPCMHFTCHIALDDQTLENGTLQYIPGSHRWLRDGKPMPILDFNFKDMEGIKTILRPEEVENFKPVPALLKKGEASFHSSLTVHGSYANRSAHPRRAAVLNYFADGVVSDSNDYMLVKITDGGGKDPELFEKTFIRKGEKMQGQFYPLVFDPEWIST